MLQKIIAIKNVGRFRSCAAAGDVAFRRITLVFAENGRGKTTLCAILRSLQTNNPAFIIGRATLGSLDPPEVRFLLSGGPVTFREGAWSAPFSQIAVFDGVYVSENVFAGDIVDTEHRRNLYRVIIGAQGVALAGRVTELDNQIRTKNNDIRTGRERLQGYIAQGITVDGFIALPEDLDIDTKIAGAEQDLQAVQRAAQLQQRAGLSLLEAPAFPAAFAALLAKTFGGIAADAERRVGEHIAKHMMQARGEPWLTEGLGYIADESCPFCGQGLAGIELIRSYREYFSRAYHALRDEVSAMGQQVDRALGDRSAVAIENTLVQNKSSIEFWQQYCQLTPPILSEQRMAGDKIAALHQVAQTLLQTKAATPLETVPPGDDFTRAMEGFDSLRASVAVYNTAVGAANAIIAGKKQQAQAANVRGVEARLAELKSQKARYTDGVQTLCNADAVLQADKKNLEDEKGRVREQLDAHTQQVITRYGQSINRYLERINAGFRITTPTHTYRGGQPSTSYQIVINQSAVELGDAGTAPDTPSFKNTLSAGDRSTLALAFFLAQLELDQNRADKVVVFDDPFTSLDSFRRSHTVHQIYKWGTICAQVIVLSHDSNFLKLLWDRVPPAERKTLQLARVGEENTAIAEWDIEKAVMARYRAQIDDLQRFLLLSEGAPRDIIQKLRPILEGYARNLYPTQFTDQDTLGVIVGKIRTAGAGHPLYPIADDLDELNLYCRRYHHGENPNAATEPIEDAELQGYVRRTLALVGCLL